MRRTLLVCRDVPYPPRSGAPLRLWQHVNVLAREGPVHVFSIGERHGGEASIPGVERWTHVDPRDFPVRRVSGPLRAQMLFRPRQYPIPNDGIDRELNARLRACIEVAKPDVIVLSNWNTSLPAALAGAPNLVVDAHNVESELHASGAFASSSGRLARLRDWAFRRRERALFERAARVWVTSDADAAAVRELAPRAPRPNVVPNAIDVDAYSSVRNGSLLRATGIAAGPPTLVYVGFFPYLPNTYAALELIDDILPRVAEHLPDVRLLLVGKNVETPLTRAAARDSRVILTGEVADVRPYLALADLTVIPLRIGGGTRMKILEAFAAGLPVISTTKGAEGIATTQNSEIAVADDPGAIVQTIVRLLRDEPARLQQAAAARCLVRERYSWDAVARMLPDALP
jgi:glycosyltransferase involved in cell wall biosynthesis